MAIRECVANGKVKVDYVHTKQQEADIMTKAIPPIQLKNLRSKLGLVKIMLILFISEGLAKRVNLGALSGLEPVKTEESVIGELEQDHAKRFNLTTI